ncbi:MAG TPA: hypothetical protein VK468_10470, partial [Pyrinomonadaceae bacterium]|nr:hypothetical protein [Pyrinomonadaceae bacterium]
MVRKYLKPGFLSCTALFSVFIFIGCAAESAKIVPETAAAERREAESRVSAGPTIKIEPNSPADTVRVFYKNLYEKKFREAIYLTNL